MADAQGTLYVCAVPIGNLADASPRLRDVLGSVDAIACEDTRTTHRLLGLLGIETKARLLAHHEHNEHRGAGGIVALLEAGQDVALVSDAGTPAVSDPGVPLVAAVHDAGIDVVAVPGPSAVAAAVSIAGFGGDGYRFVGFLPRAAGELDALFARCAGDLLVAFESPRRITATMKQLAQLQPAREVAVCRELTKRHEEVVRGAADVVAERFADAGDVKGEIVVVLAPLEAVDVAPGIDADAMELVETLVAEGVRTKRACAIVAQLRGGSARELFAAVVSARNAD